MIVFAKRCGGVVLLVLSFALASAGSANAEPGGATLRGHVPPVVAQLTPQGRLPATNHLYLAIGLPLRNEAMLGELLRQLYDPASPNFHKFLTPREFAARFGPTEADYAAVKRFAEAHGLKVAGTHPNRLVLDAEGSVSNVEQMFQITLRTYRHPTEARNFFAPDAEPSVPTNLPVADMWGLSDYGPPQPLAHPVDPVEATPLNYNGSGPGGSYQGSDFRNAYVPGTGLVGAGQIVAVAEFDGYYTNDIISYEMQCGYTNVPLTNVLINVTGTPGYSGQANAVAEVSLDIELAIAMAPGLSALMVYEGSNPYDVFNRILTDNTAQQVSCSWSWRYGPSKTWKVPPKGTTLDSILSQMVAQGQAFFQSSGDSDAYTGSQALSSSSGPIPVDSIYVTSVGGTSLTMNGTGASWSSETVWNWGNNQGSGGGISPNYSIPSWQANVSMTANAGSTVNRNIPDVALTADAVHVVYSNGIAGTFGGTSCAAPLWAGFTALVNQQSITEGGTTVGFLNPALYAIAAGSSYTNCFHDIITGNNIGNNTPGLFNAVTNYDLATGLGTPNGTNLINALAPLAFPYFITQPAGQTVTNGTSVTFSASVSGQAPLDCQWLFNGTNLPAGGNISGTKSNILSITAATTNNSGDYTLVVTNAYGSITSSVAVLSVGFAPAFSAQPADLTILSGSNAVFRAMAGGSTPLIDQWQKNGTNISDGAGISGANSNVLTLTAVTTNSSGNYTLSVTNSFGAITSSVATLAVVLPPAIASSSLTNQTVQCGSNNLTFAVAVSGTSPLNYQWKLDGASVIAATNSSFSLASLHLPSHTVTVTVTNLYGGAASNAVVTVLDTLAPVITLNSTNPLYVELGNSFIDPGATANDACVGVVPVSASGAVTTNAISTNSITYAATDGNGNTNSATRTVIVRDTTPPTILWSFTNLVLAADSNCVATMPDVTRTNYLLGMDLSGTLNISQSPTNDAILTLGTNIIVIIVNDASGNAAYSTNQIVVQDETPPMILLQPQSQTNTAGTTAAFSVGATACTPLAVQWFFNNAALAARTNSTLTLSNVTSASAGNYFVVASASGGATTSSVVTLTVNLNSPGIALASSESPSGFNDSVVFTASIAPTNATGSIQFLTNGMTFDLEPLVDGAAVSTNIASLPRGTNAIIAIYSGDANDSPATNSLTQVVTNHPPVAAPVFCTNTSSFTLNIPIASLATYWSDVDGDAVSLDAVSISTNGIILTNTGTALVYFNPNNAADQFTCTIIDGWGGTNFQTVAIAPAPLLNTTPLIIGVVAGNGGVTLSLAGAPGYSYILETTTNLVLADSWQAVMTNTLGTNGVWQFTDTQAMNFTQRFYRLQLAQ